jgi:hypothetical protein
MVFIVAEHDANVARIPAHRAPGCQPAPVSSSSRPHREFFGLASEHSCLFLE